MNKRLEGHKLGSIRVMARPGWTTSDQRWRLNGRIRVCNIRSLLGLSLSYAALAGGGNPCPNPDMTYMALARRETTGDLTEFTSGRCRYDQNLWNSIPPYIIPPLFGFVGVLARLGRTTSDQQWRLNGLRVCATRMACICTNVDWPQVSCRYLLRKYNGAARSY